MRLHACLDASSTVVEVAVGIADDHDETVEEVRVE